MNQNNSTILKMVDLLAPILSSRDVITDVIKIALKHTNTRLVFLDFIDVKFISRSVAHELLMIQNQFEHTIFQKKEIRFINMNEDVRKMFAIVKDSKTHSEHTKIEFNPKKIDIDSLLSKI